MTSIITKLEANLVFDVFVVWCFGRWAMFGFAVGLLTEYATGASFVQQLKILVSNFGILDLE